MLPTKFASMGAPATGGASISRPKEIFVTTDGNNGTGEIGNAAKPFATVDAAIAAGEGSSAAYVLILGQGTFSMGATPSLSMYRDGILGQGFSTTLTYNGFGIPGAQFTEKVLGLRLAINTYGDNAPDEFNDPGSAGAVDVEGFGWIIGINANGGHAYSGGGAGGSPGNIKLKGKFIVSGTIENMGGMDGSSIPSGGGDFEACGSDLRSASFNVGSLTLGNCAVHNSVSITNDKGGNSAW